MFVDDEGAVGIGADDYVLKPVRGEELLDWLGRTLRLEWQAAIEASATSDEPPIAAPQSTPSRVVATAGAAAPASAAPGFAALPATTSLHALAEQVRVGYPRGIHRWLDHIDATEPACGEFTRRLRALAGRFQLEAMAVDIADALQRREPGHG